MAEEALVISSDEEGSDNEEVEVVGVRRASRSVRAAHFAAASTSTGALLARRNLEELLNLDPRLKKRARARGLSSSIDLTAEEEIKASPKQKKLKTLISEKDLQDEISQEEIVRQLKLRLECPVCQDRIRHPASTTCGHIFCYSCARKWIDLNHSCPQCRKELDSADMHRIYL
eukprot:gb/GEZN01021445.1/.p1 GENE.gb/GEZN01021445.1/~~gb/GEZN01021445.1/.p1  ORF type:complete len:173 (-),score=12.89 gb/GEZN01021445.1/:69-587(-)